MNEKIRQLAPFDKNAYEKIDLDRLVIYAMITLHELGIELSWENIIVGTFKLFPNKFSIVGYPEYPDATRIEKCLWRCKGAKRHWIGGKTPHGYSVTDRTRLIFSQVKAQLYNINAPLQKEIPKTRRRERLLKEAMESKAFSKFTIGAKDSISEVDFCFMLQGTLDSPHEILRNNLIALKKISEELENEEMSGFLAWLEVRFQSFLAKKNM